MLLHRLYLQLHPSSLSCCLYSHFSEGFLQIKNVGRTYMASAKREPVTGAWDRATVHCPLFPRPPPLKLKPIQLLMFNGSSKYASFFVFYKLASQAPSVTDSLYALRYTHLQNSPDMHKSHLLRKWGGRVLYSGVCTPWRRH